MGLGVLTAESGFSADFEVLTKSAGVFVRLR